VEGSGLFMDVSGFAAQMNEKGVKLGVSKRVLSLFSGCGGMDLGLEGGFEVLEASVNQEVNPEFFEERTRDGWVRLKGTGFETVFANDIFEAAQVAWQHHFSHRSNRVSEYSGMSIVDLVKKAKVENVFPENIDIVTGGFPCQDFSIAGKRKGFDSHKCHKGNLIDINNVATQENRGMLYTWMKEVVRLVKPKVFIAENVKGLITLENVKEVIARDFEGVGGGYFVFAKLLKAMEFGVPQTRERIIFIGLRKDSLRLEANSLLESGCLPIHLDPFPIPTHCNKEAIPKDLKPIVTTGQALAGLKEPGDSVDDLSQYHYSKAKWMGNHCQGQKEIDLDGPGPTIRSEHHGNIEFRRLSAQHGGRYSDELTKGFGERRLTLRECARIQTFPDDFQFVIQNSDGGRGYELNPTNGYKVIGNAVPPLLAYHLAYRLKRIWKDLFE